MRCRRLGRFFVHDRFLVDLEPGEVPPVFQGMVVLRAESSWIRPGIDYLAMHPQFDEVPEGSIVPVYEAVFDADKATPRWVRQADGR